MEAAEGLGKIAPSNFLAINTITNTLESAEDIMVISLSIEILKETWKDNLQAISALNRYMKYSAHNCIAIQGSDNLGEAGHESIKYADPLIQLSKAIEYSLVVEEIIEISREIRQGNLEATMALIKLIEHNKDDFLIKQIIKYLEEIIDNEQQKHMLIYLQPYFKDELYQSNPNLYENCYRFLWKIAHNLPYSDFHQAWQLPPE